MWRINGCPNGEFIKCFDHQRIHQSSAFFSAKSCMLNFQSNFINLNKQSIDLHKLYFRDRIKIQTQWRFKITLFIKTKHSMRFFGVTPFFKLLCSPPPPPLCICTRYLLAPGCYSIQLQTDTDIIQSHSCTAPEFYSSTYTRHWNCCCQCQSAAVSLSLSTRPVTPRG